MTHSASNPPNPPDRIGPYKLLELLGEGGMGEVWLAEQSEPVRRRVALKIIKLGMDTKHFLARLEAERQALAVMDHPNIARFFDGGATETGRLYFVMELVRGMSITDYCDTNRLNTSERIRLFVDVCHAVQHAHHKGVVHRDLKPSNILVTVTDNRPVVKIIDFGIAKTLGHDLTDRTLVTRVDQIVGTPQYMSPEQAEMSGLDVDTRTDVYSLGVMLYELLVGVVPLDLEAKAEQAIRYAIREADIPRPSTRLTTLGDIQDSVAEHRRTTVEALRKELKSDLDWVILKAMEKDRTRRYETASGLGAELERLLRHEPVEAHAPSAAYKLGKFVKRHRPGVAFATVVAVLLIGSTTWISVQAALIARERDRAEQEAAKALAVNDFMVGTLLSPDPIDGLGRDATMLEVLDAAVAGVGDEYSEEPEVDAAIRSSIGWAYFSLSRYDEAEPLLSEALRIREGISKGEGTDLANSLHQMAALREARAEGDSAGVLYQRALDLRRRTLVPADARIAETLIRYSGLLMTLGRFDEAEENLLEALEILEMGNAGPVQISAANNRLGQLYWTQGKLEEAEPYLRSTLSERRKVLDPDHPLVGESLNNLAVLLDDLGRTEEAEALYREALVSIEAAFGETSEHLSGILGNLAMILGQKGDTSQAESLFRRALTIDLERLGPDHPSVAVDKINLGLLLCDADRGAEGLAMTGDAVRILREVLEPGQWEVGAARSAQGHCLGQVGRFAEGERELLAALETVTTALGPDHSRIERIHQRLVELYEAWGRPEEAARYRSGAGPRP
jgi:serine/threonine protein kinase/tetratricopeptide (TPR) repeat protein